MCNRQNQALQRLAPCLLATFMAALWVTQAAWAQKVQVDYDQEFDFSGFKSYAWKMHPVMEADPELRASVGAELVRMALSRELLDKGFEPVEEEFADFYVTGFGTRERGSEITGAIGGWYNTSPYYMQSWGTVMVRNYVEGTLVLDIIDAKTKQLAWRAYCQGAVRNMSKRHKVINKAIRKALKKFPPNR